MAINYFGDKSWIQIPTTLAFNLLKFTADGQNLRQWFYKQWLSIIMQINESS